MSSLSLHTGLLLGTLLGMRHALEPDHLAAVSTLVARRGKGSADTWHAGMRIGALWGLGHSIALLGVGLVVGVLHTELPRGLADAFELGVALMLVMLGARSVLSSARLGSSGPKLAHVHAGVAHTHAGQHDHVHVGAWTLAPQPLLVGLVHGLAGSGALTALALANMPSFAGRVLFMLLFGCGSILGMAVLTGLAGWPLARIARRESLAHSLTATTGLFSLLFGAFWGWPIAQSLLTQ